MGTILKLNHIAAYLCDVPGSKYFKNNIKVPPENKKEAVILRRAPEEEIIATYKALYEKILGNS